MQWRSRGKLEQEAHDGIIHRHQHLFPSVCHFHCHGRRRPEWIEDPGGRNFMPGEECSDYAGGNRRKVALQGKGAGQVITREVRK